MATACQQHTHVPHRCSCLLAPHLGAWCQRLLQDLDALARVLVAGLPQLLSQKLHVRMFSRVAIIRQDAAAAMVFEEVPGSVSVGGGGSLLAGTSTPSLGVGAGSTTNMGPSSALAGTPRSMDNSRRGSAAAGNHGGSPYSSDFNLDALTLEERNRWVKGWGGSAALRSMHAAGCCTHQTPA
jgi:hypothetical protein